MPRNFGPKPALPAPTTTGFNEAAADAAEFSTHGTRVHNCRSGFNEAAADAAEFCSSSVSTPVPPASLQ